MRTLTAYTQYQGTLPRYGT